MKLILISLLSIILFGILFSGCENLTDSVETPILEKNGVALAELTGKIAFQKSPDRLNSHNVYTMNPDGSNQTQLTFRFEHDGYPSISPNGKKIAFERLLTSGNYNTLEIFIMKSDGSGVYPLTNNNVPDTDPDYHPDGKTMVFSRQNSSGYTEIWTIRDNGSGAKLILRPGGTDASSGATWSPDGKQIVFFDNQGGDREIYVCSANGSKMTQLTNNSIDDYGASWSPDGKKIAFVRRLNSFEVFVMDSDGKNQTRLTFGNTGGNSWYWDFIDNPTWSADGTKIAFNSNRDGDYEIYIMNPDGSGQQNITNDPLNRDIAPDWGK